MQSHLGNFIRKAIFCGCFGQQNNIILSAGVVHTGGFLRFVEQTAHAGLDPCISHPDFVNREGSRKKLNKYGTLVCAQQHTVYLHKPDVAEAIHAFVPLCSWIQHAKLTHKQWKRREEKRREEKRREEKRREEKRREEKRREEKRREEKVN